jgi:hypothetical protein
MWALIFITIALRFSPKRLENFNGFNHKASDLGYYASYDLNYLQKWYVTGRLMHFMWYQNKQSWHCMPFWFFFTGFAQDPQGNLIGPGFSATMTFTDTQFKVNDFHFWRADRNQYGGGLVAYARSDLACDRKMNFY